MRFIVYLLLLIFSSIALSQEGGLNIPMSFETSKVLPKNVRNVRLRNSFFQANERYSNKNTVESLGQALNKNITFQKTISGKRDDYEAASLEAAANNANIDLNSSLGQTTGNVEANIDVFLPIIAMGITKKWTMAVAVPIVKTSTFVDAGYVSNNNVNSFAKSNLADKGLKRKVYELQEKTNNAVNNKALEYEYEGLKSEEKTSIGDIHLISKIHLGETKKLSWSLKQSITLPTGKEADINKLVSLPTGDGQWDVATGFILDYKALPSLTFNMYSGINFQLPHTSERRVPLEYDSKISFQKENLDIDLGDQFIAQLSAKYMSNIGFSFLAGYTFQYKDQDRFDGKKYQNYRYGWMSNNTEQKMHSLQAGISYSTLSLFKQKKFPVPVEANVFYTNVFKGKNVLNENMLTLEASVFF